jgi:hypothetical protein
LIRDTSGEVLEFSRAVVVTGAQDSIPERRAIDMLVEEVEKRTQIRLAVEDSWPEDSVPVIAVGTSRTAARWAGEFHSSMETDPTSLPAEGYQIRVGIGGRTAPAVIVAGNDPRGVVFGVGRLLRELRMARRQIWLPAGFEVTTAPEFPLRGHQMGYRPKTNSYDGWTLPIWEQYIRDLAIFGTNTVELIPPRSDDADDSPHFPLPKIEMLAGVSQILDSYDMDVWLWYPALDEDYSDPATVEFALKEWAEVFKSVPRLDAIMVPGGDPGHTHPRVLMPFLEKQARNLRMVHPEAELWMSPQGFEQKWLDYFFEYLNREQPSWLSGIVYGPQVRISLGELRAAIPEQYPIRRYPDITHSTRGQYAVPYWDLAFALTEGREGINPRPIDQAKIFRAYDEYAAGFITYSEGCNDDVNKFVWSGLGWDSSTSVVEILRQYSRFFIGLGYEDTFAQGLLALERNWRGPLLTNEGVVRTLEQFQEMEKTAKPSVLLNWRFQQALYRAYYDAYTRARLLHEANLEQRAMEALRTSGWRGSFEAMDLAESILKQSTTRPAQPLRLRIFQLAEALFQSIRMQLDVNLYQAKSVGRGGNLADIDRLLNNECWLREQMADIRQLPDEEARLDRIHQIVNWKNPGPGGFYDDLGNLTGQPNLVSRATYDEDPGGHQSPIVGHRPRSCWRQSWNRHADGLFDQPLEMEYSDLDKSAQYRVRIVYSGGLRYRGNPVLVRFLADDVEIHPLMAKPEPIQPLEYALPKRVTQDGSLILRWFSDPGRGKSGSGVHLAEVWLLKK